LFFSNVNADGSIDHRVAHKANSVAPGLAKYGVNIWVCERSMKGYDGNEKTFRVDQVKGFKLNTSALALAELATQQFVKVAPKKRKYYDDIETQQNLIVDTNKSIDIYHVSSLYYIIPIMLV
jgi:hypothetical protein